ncbi:MAG TPA: hypothetical protein VHF07_04585, partial [Nitrospiraceae bacterium]|nr:hypothetical protein [Nitrospiraceae bacterium]
DTQVGLRLASIKARREVLALLTPEQRAKQQAEHDRVMQQHKSMGSEGDSGYRRGHGNPHGMAPTNPHQGNPHSDRKDKSAN